MRARIEDRVVHSPYPTVEIPCCSFYDAAKKALLKDPDKPALADGTVMVTRKELFVLMQRHAAGFQKHGLRLGHRVCIHLGNSVENFAAMWACVFAGASIVLSKTSLTERELRYQLSDSDSTHVLTEPIFAEKTAKAAASLQIKGLFATGSAEGFVSTAAFRDLDEASFREVSIPDPRDCILGICYTSGTTGLPKGVVTTHYGFVANMATAGQCFGWDETDVALAATPLMHGSGLLIFTFGVLLGTTVVMESLGASLQRISEVVTKYKVTSLTLLPTHLASLVAEMQKTGIRLPGVRRIGTGGSMLTGAGRKSLEAVFSDLKCVVNGYAMTESMGILCSPSIHATRGTDVGFPSPWTQIKVVDMVTRQKLGPNQTGEICFRTPTVLKEYYKKPKETAELFDEEGWCKSGDAGYYDEDGRLHIVQRLKEMIKCMDNQVVPAELEELILEEHSDYISEVAVVGLPNAQYGEAPAAVVVLRDSCRSKCDIENLAKNIKATVADNLAAHKNLHGGVFFFDSLPKTDTGKVSRTALVQECASRSPL
uniref:Putative acyl-coa synthetase n=1 Tax=Amblyomma sculptum TaxID=1581419 RepID=A0A1E1XS76_AMBSC